MRACSHVLISQDSCKMSDAVLQMGFFISSFCGNPFGCGDILALQHEGFQVREKSAIRILSDSCRYGKMDIKITMMM